MSPRPIVIGTLIVAVCLLAAAFGPATYSALRGRPMIVDCGNATPTACEEALDELLGKLSYISGSGPVIFFSFYSQHPEGAGSCGDTFMKRGWFTFGTTDVERQPFC